MKILTILGTRPEIIRLSQITPLLDKYTDHFIAHTGQNYDKRLNDIFYKELGLRKPDLVFNTKSQSPMEQIGKILVASENIMTKFKPDRLLILGDTNSAMSAFVAKRLGIKVYHMEAGNRCYDDRVPEEVNRRVIDHSSDILMPYTERSRANLLHEGIPGEKIYVTGNPIKEVLDHYEKEIDKSQVLDKLKINPKKYFLVTLHREENVDIPERLQTFTLAFNQIVKKYNLPLVWSVHPRTAKRLEKQKQKIDSKITLAKPFGLFDFVALEKNAFCVLSDSGTVQEECCIYQVPNITLRDTTERPETVESGSNFISGCDQDIIMNGVKIVLNDSRWLVPSEYLKENVSQTVLRIITSHRK